MRIGKTGEEIIEQGWNRMKLSYQMGCRELALLHAKLERLRVSIARLIAILNSEQLLDELSTGSRSRRFKYV